MSSFGELNNITPMFKSISGPTKQLSQLLNCIRFAPKVNVQIRSEGLRFAVEEAKVMQGESS